MSVTSVRIEDDLEQPLEAAANDMNRSKGWIINEALREYLQHKQLQEKHWQDTIEALEDIRMGRTIDGNKVHAWLESWGTNEELEIP